MTRDLQFAVETVQRLADEEQDMIADVMMRLAGQPEERVEIDPSHLPDVLEGLAQARRREFASDEEVEKAFRSFDP